MPALLNVMLAGDVNALLDHEGMRVLEDADRALSRERTLAVIHAALWAYSSRRRSTAAGYAWLELLEAVGIYPFDQRPPPVEEGSRKPPDEPPHPPTAAPGPESSTSAQPAGADAADADGRGSAGATPAPAKRAMWTDERRAAFAERWHRGDTEEEIAQAVGLKASSVQPTASKLGLYGSDSRKAALAARRGAVIEAVQPAPTTAAPPVALEPPLEARLTPVRNKPADKPPEADPQRNIQQMSAAELVSNIQGFNYVVRRAAIPGLFYRIGEGEQTYTVHGLRRVLAGLMKRG